MPIPAIVGVLSEGTLGFHENEGFAGDLTWQPWPWIEEETLAARASLSQPWCCPEGRNQRIGEPGWRIGQGCGCGGGGRWAWWPSSQGGVAELMHGKKQQQDSILWVAGRPCLLAYWTLESRPIVSCTGAGCKPRPGHTTSLKSRDPRSCAMRPCSGRSQCLGVVSAHAVVEDRVVKPYQLIDQPLLLQACRLRHGWHTQEVRTGRYIGATHVRPVRRRCCCPCVEFRKCGVSKTDGGVAVVVYHLGMYHPASL
jgi:hypothetical protein